MRYALVTGSNGQAGSYLSELLLSKNYIVVGIIRRSSLFNTSRIDHLKSNPNFSLVYGDITDTCNIINIIKKIKNKKKKNEILEIYNLAAQSHVQVSFELPHYTTQVDAIGILNILEAVRTLDMIQNTKIYQASTSEMFGKVVEIPQNENTPFNPQSPYGCAKLYAHWISKNYRESYNMFICSGILFNNSSPRRGENFILKKITLGISDILNNKINHIELGNLNAKRDIGHTKDYVYGMWMMLQQKNPDDYVLATGIQYSIREFVEMAFSMVDIQIKWKNTDKDEIGYNLKDNKILVKINKKYFRKCEVDTLLGDASKMKKLGWKPKSSVRDIIYEMIHEKNEN